MQTSLISRFLKNELLIWGTGAALVVALPLGVVVLEGTTHSRASAQNDTSANRNQPENHKQSLLGNSATSSQSASAVHTNSENPAGNRRHEFNTEEVVHGVNESTLSEGHLTVEEESAFERAISDGIARAAVSLSAGGSNSESPQLQEVPSQDFVSTISYYGGNQDTELTSPDSSSDAELPNAALSTTAAVIDSTGASPAEDSVARSESPSTSPVENPVNAKESPDPPQPSEPSSKTMSPMPEVDLPEDLAAIPGETSTESDKNDEEARQRLEVILIRPKAEVVKGVDDIIFRIKHRKPADCFVLVRSRQKGASWWVQGDTLRQGQYVRARAQFGNKATVDGSRFCLVIAFVDKASELPEPGSQFAKIPMQFTLSQEFEFTRRN